MKSKVSAVASLFFLFCLGLGAPTSNVSTVEAADTIKVGVDVPLTGSFASMGDEVEFAYKLARDHINAEGGVFVKELNKKMPLELIIMDNASDPVKVASNLELLNSQYKVCAYLGGFGSGFHAAGAATAQKNKIPYLGAFFSLYAIHQKGFTYLFSPFLKSPDTAVGTFDLLDNIPKDTRPRKVAILELKDDWGKEMAGYWKQEAAKRGYEVVMVAPYAFGNKDFSSILLQAKEAGAEVLLDVGTPPTAMTLLRQAKQLNVNFKFIYIIRAGTDSAWHTNMGSDTQALCTAGTSWFHTLPFPRVKEINEAWNKKFPKEIISTSVGTAYALVEILVQAIEKAGSLDREKIRNALLANEFSTCQGRTKFNPDGSCQVECQGIVQWQGSAMELVYPFKFASKKLIYPVPSWNKR